MRGRYFCFQDIQLDVAVLDRLASYGMFHKRRPLKELAISLFLRLNTAELVFGVSKTLSRIVNATQCRLGRKGKFGHCTFHRVLCSKSGLHISFVLFLFSRSIVTKRAKAHTLAGLYLCLYVPASCVQHHDNDNKMS